MPRRVDHEQRRHELTQAAAEVIADVGLDGLTLRLVAARAGCTTGRITHYFADRDELLVGALRRVHIAAGRRMAAASSAGSDPSARLRLVLAEALPLDEERRREWRVWLAFWAAAATDPRLAAENAQRYAEWVSLIDSLVDALPDERAPGTASMLVALIDGLGVHLALDPSEGTTRSAARALDVALELA